MDSNDVIGYAAQTVTPQVQRLAAPCGCRSNLTAHRYKPAGSFFMRAKWRMVVRAILR